MSLPDGVHELPLTYDFEERTLAIHPVAVETDRGIVLVDTGMPDSNERFETHLETAGLSLADVSTVLLTHQDGDHVGGLPDLLDAVDATVLAHREAVPYLAREKSPVKGDPDDAPPAIDVDLQVVDGVRLRTHAGPMEVVHTPGHTPGHVSLYFPEARLLVAGDALFAEGDQLDRPNPQYTPDMETAIESVGRLADLAIDRTLCYHGGLVEAGTDRIREIYEEYR